MLEAGATIDGRYRLVRLLGEGGVGFVWEAVHVFTSKRYALKFLKRGSENDRRRFEREVRAAAAIRHPNVIDVHDFIAQPDGALVMVMDLLDGETLGALLARVERLPLAKVAAVLAPVLSALAAAHAARIIHRDLKPENIFLSRSDAGAVVKVLDFGTAKQTTDDDAALTGSGAILGTPYYMSPEQVLSDKDIDARTDIWSLGVILYECLSGKRPTEDETVGRVLKRIINGQIDPLETHCPDLPAEILDLVKRMLASERADRPASIADVQAILDPFATSTLPSLPPFDPTKSRVSVRAHTAADSRGDTLRAEAISVGASRSSTGSLPLRPIWIVALGLGVLAAIGIGIGVWMKRTPTIASSAFDSGPKAHPCDALPPSKVDAKGIAAMQLVKASNGTCFWIDRLETTVEQYRGFVAARKDVTTWTDAKRCAWKTTASDPEHETDHACTASTREELDPYAPNKPIRCVDWCDAREWCLWAGKDLCTSNPDYPARLSGTDEWGQACSQDEQAFPYGPAYDESKCAVDRCLDKSRYKAPYCMPDSVGKLAGCAAPNGTRDMVGNVSEWVLLCDNPGGEGPDARCSHLGGSFTDPPNSAFCRRSSSRIPKNTRRRDIGFRCCAPLDVHEQTLVR